MDAHAAKMGDSREVGSGGLLQLVPSPTPRWPDLLVAYMPSERLLFSSKLFSAHVRCNSRPLLLTSTCYFSCKHDAPRMCQLHSRC